jgi:hypothetical protein
MSEHSDLQNREGVSHGDEFNWLHRHEAGLDQHYATDLDLVLIDKRPPRISAFLDFKMAGEPVRFTQAVAFEQLQDTAPVYIIRAESPLKQTPVEEHRFTVYKFIRAVDTSPTPPEIETEVVRRSVPWGGLVEHSSRSDFLYNGGDGLIGWEHTVRYPDRVLTDGGDLP